MGKTKNLLEGLDDALERADDAYQYEQWRNSKEYVDMANESSHYTNLNILMHRLILLSQKHLNHFKLPQKRWVLMYMKNSLDNISTKIYNYGI